MKKIENGYCDYYFLTEAGEIYDKDKDIYIKPDKDHKFRLKREDNTVKKIALRPLYKLVFDRVFCNDNIKDLDQEEWKPIERTENIYFVSNLGRIKSYAGYEAIILKPTITPKGYERLDIIQEGQRISKLVHTLVAAAFLPKPDSIELQIHHKDFNKLNNAAANLQYVTLQQHTKIHTERREKTKNAGSDRNSTKPESIDNTQGANRQGS